MTENEIANKIIGCAIEVHKTLGPGLLENAYQECLFYKLAQSGLKVERENQCLWYSKKFDWKGDIELIYWSKRKL